MAMASATTDLADMSAYKAEAISAHILKQLAGVAQRRAGTGTGTGSGTGSGRIAPLIVGLQGPQGSGKTTVTELVQDRLRQRGTTSAVFSLDGEAKRGDVRASLSTCLPKTLEVFASLLQIFTSLMLRFKM